MDAHIFIDNSNLFGGAQRAAKEIEPTTPWQAVRVYYSNIFQLIEKDLHPVTRILAGSLPPGNDALWDYARNRGYNTDLLQKIEKDNGRLGEQGVDEILHLKIANALLDYDSPQTLVLVTGDGQDADFSTSFLQQVQRALKRGWHVKVWSWKSQLSGNFAKLLPAHASKLEINKFDPHYNELTFIKGGNYSGTNIQPRIVGRLQIT
jgi:hypothetical protein